jgi:16S rRNA (guanine527-N7)-methyltransferase
VSSHGAGPVEVTPGPASLLGVLAAARERGFIGGPDLVAHVRQADALVAAVQEQCHGWSLGGDGAALPTPVLDLGSGGGLPGLVLADRWPTVGVTLLDGSTERSTFLVDAVDRLGWTDRVRVAGGRAEELGRDPALRHRYELVVARSFGPPAVVAECGAPFLVEGGRLVVSEPPDADGSRWDAPASLAALGLSVEALVARDGHRFQILRADTRCSDRYPRRTGIPTKRPLF